jgi:hypothetical protein
MAVPGASSNINAIRDIFLRGQRDLQCSAGTTVPLESSSGPKSGGFP